MSESLCRLARQSIESYIKKGVKLRPDVRLGLKAGCFVSLHHSDQLRGCIGSIEPMRQDLAEEILENAISAATSDPRFPPVTSEELEGLAIEVSVLHPKVEVNGVQDLDAQRYGVIVENGLRRGVLLPDLDGVDTPAQQLAISRKKAGIGMDEPVKIWRFEVEKHHESSV